MNTFDAYIELYDDGCVFTQDRGPGAFYQPYWSEEELPTWMGGTVKQVFEGDCSNKDLMMYEAGQLSYNAFLRRLK